MRDLIEALMIFAKYQAETYAPTHCEHDVLYVVAVEHAKVSEDDRKRLKELGFLTSEEDDSTWLSFRFGSA